MIYLHYLYPLPPLKRLVPAFNESGRPSKPDLDWTRYRLWPEEPTYKQTDDGSIILVNGLFRETKVELAIARKASWKLHEALVNYERAAAKEVCERMTIQEAWTHLQGHIHTNEYDIEGMSEADWDIFLHAKNLLNNHIESL